MNEGMNCMSSKKEIFRFVKFAFFSASAGLIQAVSFALLSEGFSLPYWVCYLTALTLSVVWNFTLNRKFTFHSANNVPVAMAKVAAFYAVFTPPVHLGGKCADRPGLERLSGAGPFHAFQFHSGISVQQICGLPGQHRHGCGIPESQQSAVRRKRYALYNHSGRQESQL